MTFSPLVAYLFHQQVVGVLLPTPQPIPLELQTLQGPALEVHDVYVHYRWQPTSQKDDLLGQNMNNLNKQERYTRYFSFDFSWHMKMFKQQVRANSDNEPHIDGNSWPLDDTKA